jgi:hypothetical protein
VDNILMENIAHLYKITNIKTGEYYVGKHRGMTQETRWALRVGRPPTILPHDNDVRLVRSWCANGDA